MPLSRRWLLSSGVLAGCGARLGQFPFDRAWEGGTLGLHVRFYSVCCMRIGFGEAEVLVDPFFSHLPLRQVAFGQVRPDLDQVQPYLGELSRVRAVVIGHNHYDHNLDLPAIAEHLAPDAHVLGSRTMVHTFAPCDLATPLVGMNDQLDAWWVHPSAPLRVMPLLSGHPPQWGFVHLYRGRLTEDADRPPHRGGDYQEGLTLAFLVDFEGGPRVYIQTSSTGLPAGRVPPEVLASKPVDFAVLPMDCANLAMAGERTILDELDPSVVLFCHLEDFFRPKSAEPREIVKVDLPRAHDFFDSSGRTVLFPGSDSTFSL